MPVTDEDRRRMLALQASEEDEGGGVMDDVQESAIPGVNQGISNMLKAIAEVVAGPTMRRAGVDANAAIDRGAEALGINTKPKEDTTRQKIMAGGGRGLGAGAMFGPAAAIPGAVGGASGSAAKEGVAALGGGETAQNLADIGGGLVGGSVAGSVQNTVAKGVNMARGAAPAATPQLQAMQAEGVTPRMVGDATGSNVAKQATAFMKDAPVTGGIIRKAAQQSIDELAIAADRTAGKLGAATSRADAGQAITAGVQNYTRTVAATAERLFGALRQVMPGTTPVQASNTINTVGDVSSALAQMPKTSNALTPSLFKSIGDDLATNGSPSFATLSRLRTEIGKKLSDPMLVDDVGRADLKRIYGALTDDLKTAVSANPQAARLFDISNEYYKKQMQFIEGSFQKLAAHGVNPETLYQWATSEGRIGATRLAALKKAMGNDEFGNVSAVVFRGLGAPGGNAPFDPATFVRNWDKGLSQSAKKVLFDGDHRESIDRIALIAKEMQQTGALANSSRTAGTAQLLTWIGAIGGSVVGGPVAGTAGGIGAAIVGQGVASKLLTSSGFAKWLATDVGPGGISRHLKLLPQIAMREPQISAEVKEFLEAVAAVGDQ
jgi:hypothetical protein